MSEALSGSSIRSAAAAPAVSAYEQRTRYRVSGMDCASCAAKIETALKRLPGVSDVGVSVPAGTVTVSHADTLIPSDIADQVSTVGYQVTGSESVTGRHRASIGQPHAHGPDYGHDRDHDHGQAEDEATAGLHAHMHDHGARDGPWWKSSRGLLTIACGLALVAAFVVAKLAPATERWAFLLAMTVGLVPIARRALVAARFGTPFSIEMLMTIAAVGAVLIGATEEAATVVILFLVGELLEGVAAGRARKSIQDLTKLVPKTALLEREGGQTTEVPADSLAVGSVILVRPGDRIPADGLIVSGESAVDEAPVTGESTPRRKGEGAPVFAGTINTDGALRIQVTAAAADNTIARVVRLVEEAQESKAPTERFIDRFSRYYTPGVVVLGALVAVVPPLLFDASWSAWIYKGLANLHIGFP
jgi:Cd2+/Zn2+-exporting ATPase